MRLDRPSSGGGDKPGEGTKPPGIPPPDGPQANPVTARSWGHYERSAAESNRRGTAESGSQEQAEGTGQNARGREGTAAARVGDHLRRPADASRETGNGTDTSADRNGYQALYQRQDQVIKGHEQRIARLQSDLGKRDKTIEKRDATIGTLEDRNERLQDRLEEKDRTTQQKDQTIDRQAEQLASKDAEIGRLRSELAKKNDKPAGSASEVDAAPGMRSNQAVTENAGKPATPWYRKIPSQPVTDIVAKTAAVAGTVGVATGALNGTAEKIAGGVAAIGLAAMEYKRQKSKEGKGEDDG